MKNMKKYNAPNALVIQKNGLDIIRTSEFELPPILIDDEESANE